MYLSQLKYFLTVARLQHMTQAAKELRISQSTLSNTIHKLEESLNVSLFDREGRNIVLNQNGRLLQYYGKAILNEVDDLYLELSEMQALETLYTVSLGVNDSNFHGNWLFALLEQNPELKLKVLHLPQIEIQRKLLTGELYFGFILGALKHPKISSIQLLNQPYLVLMPRSHPLARQKYISPNDIINLSYIVLPQSEQNRMIDFLSAELHFTPHIVFEGHSESMKEIMQTDIGCILTCEHNLKYWLSDIEDREHFVILPVVGIESRYEIYLTWHKERYLPLQAQFFRNFLKEYYHEQQQALHHYFDDPKAF